jgi:alpha-L-fucosidase
MKRFGLILLVGLCATAMAGSDDPNLAWWRDSMKTRDQRIAWWREARFGMFVHWGVYAQLGGTWQGRVVKGYAEHIQRILKIPIPVYREQVAGQFNPTEFNADEWIRTAKEAGMGYFIITAKHHDGFAMWDSKVHPYNIVAATPFKRDPMKELRAACRKYGVKFGFYYSHAFDWGDPNGPGNDWDYDNPGGDRNLHGGRNWWQASPELLPKVRTYVDGKSIPQILELVKNYEPDILWFDTPHKLPPEENLRIMKIVRLAAPNVVINGRLVRGLGDYESTADRPAEFAPHDGDWEGIPTTNESYGWNQNDNSHKPASHFIRLLAKAAARGGNTLMNVGPMGNGRIDPKDTAILQGIGAWWKINGESIRGTTRTPLAVQSWGESTRKGNTLYLHVFQWPSDRSLVVGGLKSEVKKAWLLAEPGRSLDVTRPNPLDVRIDVPTSAPDQADSVIAVECAGGIETDSVRLLSSVQMNSLRVFDGQLHGRLSFGPGKKTDAYVQNWSAMEDSVSWPVRVNSRLTFSVVAVYDAQPQSEGGVFTLGVGSQHLAGTVKSGAEQTASLGTVTLEPGSSDVVVTAKEIKGSELMRLRRVELKPITDR